ncbi:hypothetical protein QJS10_CPB18g00542 [Acorus calamus]|uniref:Uncharacterized protein n=1 Tax=Acorus calamus TaxID=4465 RepID=A0AAV9CKQ1_ACOCL|nr:hypothetical protein QJS10_CPB18g00542 [Acorus calamus]
MGETMPKPRGGRRWRCGGRRSGGFLEGLLREVERKKESAANGRCGCDVGRPIAGSSHSTVDVNRTRPSDAMDP